jgi:tetratricopeptide (TPR) repeat protein
MKATLVSYLILPWVITAIIPVDVPSRKILHQAGQRAYREGRYLEAERAFTRASQEAEKAGEQDPRLPSSLIDLAEVKVRQGHYGQADLLCLRARRLLEKPRKPEELTVARCLNVQAQAYRFLGLFAEAETLARRSFAIREKHLGRNHPDVAECVDTLAALTAANEPLFSEGKVIGSRGFSLTERSLQVRERALGTDHPGLTPSLLTVAADRIHHSPDDLSKAEKYLQRAITIVRKAHGEQHPDMAQCLTMLARVCRQQDNLKSAEHAQQQALAIWEKTIGAKHPPA